MAPKLKFNPCHVIRQKSTDKPKASVMCNEFDHH